MDNSKIAQKMQRQIEELSGILAAGLPKVSQRLVGEAIRMHSYEYTRYKPGRV